ncbi:MAG: M1 family aminopeptidase, partial [Planctomycetota bacterium]
MLHTPGSLAMASMNTLTLLVCMLLLFYTVESHVREHHTKLGPICYATSVRTGSLIFGKTIANAMVGAIVLAAALAGFVIALLIQGRVGLDLRPFLIVWGLLMLPTFMVWSAFVAAVLAIVRNRYTAYAVALVVFIYTLYRQLSGQMSWVGNWNAWGIGAWSDISRFELDRTALVLNRVMAVGLSVLFTAVAVRFYFRREFDATRIVHRLRPQRILRTALWLLPFLVVPALAGGMLWNEVEDGFQGRRVEDLQKDYWKQNLATFKDAPLPSITHVELDVDVAPAERRVEVAGSYALANLGEVPLGRIPLTAGAGWEDLAWTLDGAPHEPENRSGLHVFAMDPPLAPGDSVTIGFSHAVVHPRGITKNGGGTAQFILPSGVVLHSFSPSFAPVLGFVEGIGTDEENAYEPRDYPDDFHEGVTEPLFGAKSRFTTRVRISGPDEFIYNSVGVLVSEEVRDGQRTVVWESDFPVTFFNLVAGRWAVREGNGTKVFYHPEHDYNIDEISAGLDAARKYYSEWFMPFPWSELKLSEFPALANYAQGFATNITFSEGIGFLARSDPRTNVAFMVTAHEAAHQWWGNLLQPGKGPGGNVLSEGMAHFSTILLIEQVKGERDRIEFCRRIEESYGDDRRVDAEQPLVRTDGSKSGDQTVMYDKGGWVFWMLLQHMGRERGLAGVQEFIRHYSEAEDRPVLQDFVATMRRHAPDAGAFDELVDQLFFRVVVPEYRLLDVRREALPGGGHEVVARLENRGTGRMPVEVAAMSGERFDEDGSTR